MSVRVKIFYNQNIAIKILFWWLGLCLFTSSSLAEDTPVSIATHLDTSLVTIGDPIHYKVQFKYPKGTEFELPPLDQKLGEFEIQDQYLTTPERKGDNIVRSWLLKLAAFDTGQVTIPKLKITAYLNADTSRTLVFETNEKIVEVVSVLPPGEAHPKDIKPPLPLPTIVPWDWILFILLILMISVTWYYFYRRWRSQCPEKYFEERHLEPPALVAHRRLKQIKKNYAPTTHKRRKFYFNMSHILREYLERRYYILALEMSTDEIVEALTAGDLENERTAELEQIFNQLDNAKFAGQYPRQTQDFDLWESIFQWIEHTRREYLLSQRSGLTDALERVRQVK